jgi:hypothetical protein
VSSQPIRLVRKPRETEERQRLVRRARIAKARVCEKLGSSDTKSEGQQNMLCAYLSGALLVGLWANALVGLWWADPITALLIAGVAVKEGRESWRGESCCAAPVGDGGAEAACRDDDCCS